MGDRTNITDALDKFDHCTGGWVCPAVAHFHGCHCDDGNCDRPAEHTAVPLRADPDTSDELAAEARRLLDGYPDDVFRAPPEDWKAGMVTGQIPDATDEYGYADLWITSDAFAAHVLRTIALPVIAALLERAVTAEADRGEAERRERTAVNLANYHRDVARTAGGRAEHAEAEARQLREAIGDPDELRWHRWHCEETGRGDDLRELLVRIADAADAAADRGVTDGEATTSRRPVQFDAYASNPWPDGETTDG